MGSKLLSIIFIIALLQGCKQASSESTPTVVTTSGDAIVIKGNAIIFSANNFCLGREEDSNCLNELQSAYSEAQKYFQDADIHIEVVKNNFVISESPTGARSVVNVFQSSDAVFICTADGKVKTLANVMDFDAMKKALKN
jgi:hypothetical protein